MISMHTLRFIRLSPILSLVFLAACATPDPVPDISDAETGTGTLQESSVMLETSTGSYEVGIAQDVTYAEIDGTRVTGYMTAPEGDGPFPALVLIHEWWGLNENIRALAEDFARQGYVALAVDMYEGESTTEQARARELSGGVQENMDRALENLRQATIFLRAQSVVNDDALASVGWCFGGGWAYQMARNDLGLDASVMYYGRFSPHEDHSHMRTDIIGHFGEEDMSISVDDVETFQATLQTTSGEHEIYIYPNAGHGFANEDNPAHNPEAAALAWQRTIDFLSQHVR